MEGAAFFLPPRLSAPEGEGPFDRIDFLVLYRKPSRRRVWKNRTAVSCIMNDSHTGPNRKLRPWFLFAGLALAGTVLSFLIAPLNSPRHALTEDGIHRGPRGPYQRIICGTPGITEIVFGLGAGDRVVGVSQFSSYPPQAAEKPVIGGLINPNRERITSLRPDLLITQGKHESLAAFCRQQGITFLSLEIEMLEDVWDAIARLGRLLGAAAEASRLEERIKAGLHDLSSQTAPFPKKKVFFVLGHSPGDLSNLMSIGPRTFIHQLITAAGGINIFADARITYPQISKESLLRRRPEIIIEVITGDLGDEKIRVLENDWSQLSILPAVAEGRIHFLNQDYLLIPGTRLPQTARLLSEIIHPEAFNGPDQP
jgi:iron complex transport system substrate-binding protein